MWNSETRDGRILIIDDNRSIHDDFQKILLQRSAQEVDRGLDEVAANLFGHEQPEAGAVSEVSDYSVDNAFQGEEGLKLVVDSVEKHEPYDLAFVDMRMPPGWNGVETISHLWEADPDLQVVICTAYSDFTWSEIVERIGQSDKLLILKKPFDTAEVSQIASALVEKRRLARMAAVQLEKLERMVEERTRKLKVAMERAEQASLAKSEFLANMSHELRTPLTAILGYAETFLDGDAATNLSPDQVKAVDIIGRSGEHLLQVINGILDLSKIEAGRLVIETVECSPRELAEEVASTLGGQAASKGLPLQLNISADVPRKIACDPVRVRQILLNLVGNSIKFTAHGNVDLSLTCTCVKGQRFVRFRVVDTGIGIEPSRLKAVFDPFVQADTSTTRKFGGTGLGLTVSRRLAQKMGGDICVTSRPGSGSTFTFDVPYEEHFDKVVEDEVSSTQFGSPREAKATHHDEPLETSETLNLNGARVLLAEDDRLNQHFIAVMMRRAGADVSVASDGQEAFDLAVNSMQSGLPFDVILMDMQMPVLDGYGAAARLRQNNWEGPIIALTAHAMNGDREKCIEAGCTDYLTKPVKRDRLLPIVERWWKEQAGRSPRSSAD